MSLQVFLSGSPGSTGFKHSKTDPQHLDPILQRQHSSNMRQHIGKVRTATIHLHWLILSSGVPNQPSPAKTTKCVGSE